MAREYLIRPHSANVDDYPDGEHYLARTVFEDFELIDTGVLDAFGNKVMARQRLEPIGFIRHK
ncbi:hypothetical protein NKH75_07090 [Mesorhizobium sp. M0984]|uniref:hypothetical protein n=1 Tax=Mesorhizobium sp. M0984 TaxID=2957041 RepID=UPI00333DF7BE